MHAQTRIECSRRISSHGAVCFSADERKRVGHCPPLTRAELRWDGELMTGNGEVAAGTRAFSVPVRFPAVAGDPPGSTTPEELLAAAHAACYGIGLRSLIARKGGHVRRVVVEAIVTAEKGADGIRIQSSHLLGVLAGLKGLEEAQLRDISGEVADRCTISLALRGAVRITHELRVEGSE